MKMDPCVHITPSYYFTLIARYHVFYLAMRDPFWMTLLIPQEVKILP